MNGTNYVGNVAAILNELNELIEFDENISGIEKADLSNLYPYDLLIWCRWRRKGAIEKKQICQLSNSMNWMN